MFIVAKMSLDLARRLIPKSEEKLTPWTSIGVLAKDGNGRIYTMQWRFIPDNKVTPRGK